MINFTVDTTYESDHTQWMREMQAKHPEWESEQQTGRALWWDKKQDLESARSYADSAVPQKPYPYDVNFSF